MGNLQGNSENLAKAFFAKPRYNTKGPWPIRLNPSNPLFLRVIIIPQVVFSRFVNHLKPKRNSIRTGAMRLRCFVSPFLFVSKRLSSPTENSQKLILIGQGIT